MTSVSLIQLLATDYLSFGDHIVATDSPVWLYYFTAAFALAVLEIFIPGFVLLPLGLAVALTGVSALFTSMLEIHLVVLVLSTIAVFWLSKKYVHTGKREKGTATNVDDLIGKVAVVEEEISDAKNTGYVRLYGTSWRAVSVYDDCIPVGSKVFIEKVSGNKLVVSTT
ncbi:MAG: NfeD family protein [Bdellovibrionaceae bacterium]|nr:NfeD family protein [Bdellovibrionales bacterium]MCB9254029.1 NfeD family protein [Pseudobdellovibrionaceae bacterium]